MRRSILVLAALLVAALVVMVGAPLLVSSDEVRREVTQRLRALTGYEVAIGGPAELQMFPSLRFSFADVSLRVPGAPDGAELADIDALVGSVRLMPLVSGNIEIDRFTLVRPQIDLVVDQQGRRNWIAGDDSLIEAAIGQPNGVSTGGVRIGDLRIEDGTISYSDRRTGEVTRSSDIDAGLSWPTLTSPISGTGTAVWKGEAVGFSFGADMPLALLGGGASPARLELSPRMADISFSGQAHGASGVELDGQVTVSARSARELLRWFGTDFGSGAGLEGLEVTGTLSLVGHTASLSNMEMALDGNHAVGSVELTAGGDAIGVAGTLAFDSLDLNPYRAAEPSSGSAQAGPLEPETLAKRIDLADLRRIAADIRLSAESVAMSGVTLGRTAAAITVRDGVLTLGLGEAQIYGGTATGTATVQESAGEPRTRIDLTFEGVQSEPLLAATAGVERLQGIGSAVLHLTGSGDTLSEILGGLSGNASFRLAEGALDGIDLPGLIDSLESGRINGWPSGDDARTAFGEVSASFRIAEGTATTEDFRLAGPDLLVSAGAVIHLASASIAGEGTAELTREGGEPDPDASLPFLVEGPITRPALYPDPVWMLSRAAGSPGELGRLRRRFEEQGGEEVVDDLLRRGMERLPGVFREPR